MHPKSLEIFERAIKYQGDTKKQEAFINEEVSEKNIPSYEMAKLIWDEVCILVKTYQRGIIAGVQKSIDSISLPPSLNDKDDRDDKDKDV